MLNRTLAATFGLLLLAAFIAAGFPANSKTATVARPKHTAPATIRTPGACPHGIIYVNHAATGANTGESWANAFTDLQAALACATSGDEIWVARGTYKPTPVTTPPTPAERAISFVLKSGVGLYGGFAGTETARHQRNPDPEVGAPNQTILSGDIGPVSFDNNSLHVLIGDNTNSSAIVDGFMVTFGNAVGGATLVDNTGGGMRNLNGSPTVRNILFFRNNATNEGGGMYNGPLNAGEVSNPTLVNVTFRRNSARKGGGMANFGDSLFNQSFPKLDNVTFDDNTGGAGGGGMYNGFFTMPTLRNCLFKDNEAERELNEGIGGAIYSERSSPVIIGCTFVANLSQVGGGAIGGINSHIKVYNSKFHGNQADGAGGAILSFGPSGSSVLIVNSVFSGNSVGLNQPGHSIDGEATTIINSSFWSVSAGGREIDLHGGSLHNVIVWIGHVLGSPPVTNSIIQDGCPIGSSCTNVSSSDPLLVDPDGADDILGTLDDDLHPQPGSPAIDMGNNANLPPDAADLDNDGNVVEPVPFDLDGAGRIGNGTVDIGAYERCGLHLMPDSAAFPANVGTGTPALTGTINVALPASCNWTAMSNDSFIMITGDNSGMGNGTVSYSLTPNPSNSTRRTGTITIANQTFTVLQGPQYLDVPTDHPFYTFIGKLAARGVTVGCGNGNFCPTDVATREQMAAFIIRARGEFNPPPPMSQRFDDVPPTNTFYNFINRMAVLQITQGCSSSPPLYCPMGMVTREQAAAFIIRALNPPGFIPLAPGTQRFQDVPPTSPFFAHIDEMAARGITHGCSASPPLFCPSNLATRAEIAVFLVRAFGL